MEPSIYLAPWIGLILLMSAHLASLTAAGRAPILRPVLDAWRLRSEEDPLAARSRGFGCPARLGAAPDTATS